MQIHRRTLAGLCLALAVCAAFATSPESGKVYRVKNVLKSTYMTANGITGSPYTAALNANNDNQLWLTGTETVEGIDYTTLRCLGNGYYLMSATARSVGWTMTDSADDPKNQFVVGEVGGNIVLHSRAYGENMSMHSDPYNDIVGWSTDAMNSRWIFEEVTDVDTDALLAKWESLAAIMGNISTYQSYLDTIFADKACTTLNPGATETSIRFLARKLPTHLRNLIINKMLGDDWAEYYDGTNDTGDFIEHFYGEELWDAGHARKYRVQSYEPYSEGNQAAQLAGIQAHTNMNNPTGIVCDTGQLLYVMVNDPVPAGAILRIAGTSGDGMLNDVTAGYELHQGLNIIPCYNDNTIFYIFYTVNTAENVNGKWQHTDYKVTDFAPITIHIEGGRVNGFFDPNGDSLYAADTRADFDYTSWRATHPMYDLKGKYVILHFYLEDTPNSVGDTTLSLGVKSSLDPWLNPATNGANKEYDPVVIMKYWDEMCFAERVLMGIQSDEEIADEYNRGFYSSIVGDDVADPGFHYSDYFNNRMLGLNMQGHYMDATAWRTAYGPSTIASVLTDFPYGTIWGPAHEYGHINQSPMRIAGTSEESNNIFSNVALFFHDHGTTSRAEYPLEQQKVFARGGNFLENDTWGTTRMFLQLWLYYHATKHNTKFYPRLYELLRQNPLQKSYDLNPRYDLLHFAKMCCIAAQEDLTNYFEAWGVFVPLDNYHVGDYSSWRATLTQEDIDAVKAEIAALNLPKNDAILLIDDRVGSDKPSHEYFQKKDCGQYGGLAAFESGLVPCGNIEAALGSDCSLHFTVADGATPGAGFLLYDSEGNILGFSNCDEMILGPEALTKVVCGEAVLVAQPAASDETASPIELEISPALVRTALSDLLRKANLAIGSADNGGTYVGKFLPDYLIDIQIAADAAQNVMNNANADVETLTAAYNALYADYSALTANRFARVAPVEGNKYQLLSRQAYSGRSYDLVDNGDGVVRLAQANAGDDHHLWCFEAVSRTYDTYYIRNAATGKYISFTSGNNGVTLTDNAGDNNIYQLKPTANPAYLGILQDSKEDNALNIAGNTAAGNITTWGWADANSQWSVILTDTDDDAEAQYALDESLRNARELLKRAGGVTETVTPVQLTGGNYYCNAPATGMDYNSLCDGNDNTIYHTVAGYSNVTDYHHIRMNLGKEHMVQNFKINYITRPTYLTEAIARFNLQVSNDGINFSTLATVGSGLPTSTHAVYTSPVFMADAPQQFVRIQVTEAEHLNGYTNVPYFVISQLGISNVEAVPTPDDDFAGADALMESLYFACIAAENACSAGDLTGEQITDIRLKLDKTIAELNAYAPSGSLGEALRRAKRLLAQVPDYPQVDGAMVDALTSAMAACVVDDINAACDAIEAVMVTDTVKDDSLLLALIKATEALLRDTGTVTYVKGDAIPLTAAQLYSNAPYLGNNADNSSNMGKLLDGNTNTYFHSRYGGADSDDSLDHYIQITLANPAARSADGPQAISLCYNNRATDKDCPTLYHVEQTTDKNTWTRVLSSGSVTYGGAAAHESEPFVIDPATLAVRMVVKETKSNEKSGAHPFFAISEIGLNEYSLEAEPNEHYSGIETTAMTDAFAAMEQAKVAVPGNQEAAMSNLQQKYDALVNARETMTRIIDVAAGAEAPATGAVYDLQGRRVANPGRGIYIVNGRKVLR